MRKPIPVPLCLVSLSLLVSTTVAQDKPNTATAQDKARIFITDSQSWEMGGHSGGSAAGFGGEVHGGARPQTAEIVKTFGERCPLVVTNNIQTNAHYVVVLDHEGGKGLLRHRNKVAVFNRVSGDSVVSKSTLSLGGSVQTACEAIDQDWGAHGPAIRAAAAAAQNKAAAPQSPAAPAPAATPTTAKLSVASIPDGADIEVDGSFVGNTPSDIDVPAGEHTVTVKKSGFQTWEKKLKVSGGSNVHLKAEMEKSAN
ncbi:MAG TPA: PEGA domain-containing protein [Candidatus Limnocylindria bacterium]|nr:PEGA domain-containing protein [Candidatus Limnocylindria bacterium]